jgi:hypothetical protein
MKLKRGQIWLMLFVLAYVLAFAVFYINIQNYEFLWYVGVLVFFFLLIALTLHRSKFDYLVLWGLAIWGLLHMAGGGVRIGDGVLYGWEIIKLINIGDTYILKFDQFVHAFGFCVTTLVTWHLLKPYLGRNVNYKIIYPLIVAVSMGLGALNEIVEFAAVVVFPETGVGGYFNTGLDLIFNMLGAIIGAVIVHYRSRKIY